MAETEATALATREDVIVVASVSAIYNLCSPQEYQNARLQLEKSQIWPRKNMLTAFAKLQYERNDIDFMRGTYRVRGETIEVYPSYENKGLRITFSDDVLDKLEITNPKSWQNLESFHSFFLYH